MNEKLIFSNKSWLLFMKLLTGIIPNLVISVYACHLSTQQGTCAP